MATEGVLPSVNLLPSGCFRTYQDCKATGAGVELHIDVWAIQGSSGISGEISVAFPTLSEGTLVVSKPILVSLAGVTVAKMKVTAVLL